MNIDGLVFETCPLWAPSLDGRLISTRTHPIAPSYRACFAPIASAMIAVTRLLMLTPSFSACFVNFE